VAELKGLGSRLDDFKAAGAYVVAVSAQTPEENAAMGLPFPVLSDPDLEVTERYGLVHPKGYLGKDAPRPATIVIDTGGTIRWVGATDNLRYRPAPEDLLARLR
jgi:peroxiredoxin